MNNDTKSFLIFISKFLVKAIIVLVPLFYIKNFFFFPFIAGKTIIFIGLIDIVFFAWLLVAIYNSEFRPKINLLNISVLVFLVALYVSSIFGVDFSLSFWSTFERMSGLLVMTHFVAFFFVVQSLFREKKEWRSLLILSTSVAVVVSIFSWFGAKGLEIWNPFSYKGGSTLGNTSFAGSYLLFNVFFLAYLYLTEEKKKNKRWFIVRLILIALSPIFISYKLISGQFSLDKIIQDPAKIVGDARAATMATISGLVLVFFWFKSHYAHKELFKKIYTSLFAISVVVGLASVIMLAIPNSPSQKFLSNESSKSRVAVWGMAFQGFKEKPIFGWGFDTFSYVYQSHYEPYLLSKEYGADSWFDKPHNYFLEILVSSGVVGIISWLFIYVAVGILLLRIYKKEEDDVGKRNSFVLMAVFSALLIAHFVQNLTVFDTVSSYLMRFLALAFISYQYNIHNNDNKIIGGESIPNSNKLPFIMCGVVGLFAFAFIFSFVLPYRANHAIQTSSKIRDMEIKEKYINKISQTPIGQSQEFVLITSAFRDGASKSLTVIKKNPEILENAVKELSLYRDKLKGEVVRRPDNFKAWVELSRVDSFYTNFGVAGLNESGVVFLDEAEESAKKAIEIQPKHQYGYWVLAEAQSLKGDLDGALKTAEYALSLWPDVDYSKQVIAKIKARSSSK